MKCELFTISSTGATTRVLFTKVEFALTNTLIVVFNSTVSGGPLILHNGSRVRRYFVLYTFRAIVRCALFCVNLTRADNIGTDILSSLDIFLSLVVSALTFGVRGLATTGVVNTTINFFNIILVGFRSNNFNKFSLGKSNTVVLSTLTCSVSNILVGEFSRASGPITLSN